MNFESIHNYYEPLVIERIMETLVTREGIRDEDFLNDVACVALNALPARYVRHDVDMAFFLTSEERARIAADVEKAVADAVERVREHRRGQEDRGGLRHP